MHAPSSLASGVATSYSILSDKFGAIFLRYFCQKVFNIKHFIYVYISFSSNSRTKYFEKDNCLVYREI